MLCFCCCYCCVVKGIFSREIVVVLWLLEIFFSSFAYKFVFYSLLGTFYIIFFFFFRILKQDSRSYLSTFSWLLKLFFFIGENCFFYYYCETFLFIPQIFFLICYPEVIYIYYYIFLFLFLVLKIFIIVGFYLLFNRNQLLQSFS